MLDKMYSTGIILLLAINTSIAAQIEGFWQVNKSNDLVEIQRTREGLKAKLVTSNDWDYYELLRSKIYENRSGNRYYIESSDRLRWESRDGRRVIQLRKTRNNNRYDRYDDDRRGRNQQYDDSDFYDDQFSNPRNRLENNGLSGTWSNRWTNTIMDLEYDGFLVRMRTNRSRRWVTYRRTNSRRVIFADRWGNSLLFKNNGEVRWRRADGLRNLRLRRHFR